MYLQLGVICDASVGATVPTSVAMPLHAGERATHVSCGGMHTAVVSGACALPLPHVDGM